MRLQPVAVRARARARRRPDQLAAWGGQAGLGFDERAPAAAFVQSNCKVPSGRTELVANLMSFGDVPVHSYGKCGPTLNITLTLTARCPAGAPSWWPT